MPIPSRPCFHCGNKLTVPELLFIIAEVLWTGNCYLFKLFNIFKTHNADYDYLALCFNVKKCIHSSSDIPKNYFCGEFLFDVMY